jgi:hypothetical protein
MSTQKQIAANRQNAQKSTGPKTPEGRAAVRLNGVTHGLTAQTLILKGETESDFDSLLASSQAEYSPTTPPRKLWSSSWPCPPGACAAFTQWKPVTTSSA